jgi:hypothetical protein
MAKSKNRDPLAWGIILVVIGAIFLFNNLDFGIWDLAARLWPLILILWGAWKLYFGLKEQKESKPPEITQD